MDNDLPSELPVVAVRDVGGLAMVRSADYQRAVRVIVQLKERIAALEVEVLKARVAATNADRTAELAEKDKRIAALEDESKAMKFELAGPPRQRLHFYHQQKQHIAALEAYKADYPPDFIEKLQQDIDERNVSIAALEAEVKEVVNVASSNRNYQELLGGYIEGVNEARREGARDMHARIMAEIIEGKGDDQSILDRVRAIGGEVDGG